MDDSPRSRLLAVLVGAGDGALETHLCDACLDVLKVDGASVAVFANDADWGALCSSDATSTSLLDLQHTLGEGPTLDAYQSGAPVSAAALANPQDLRWLAFSGQAHAGGTAAVFAFPVSVGAARVGVLTLHQKWPGPLTGAQHADALRWADALADLVLSIQAHAPPLVLAAPLEAVASHHAEVHQAAGILSARLGVGLSEALVRLRAHAYVTERPLADVARDVVTGSLRFD